MFGSPTSHARPRDRSAHRARPLVDPHELRHPAVPPALDGYRLMHLADTHVRAVRDASPRRRWSATLDRLAREVGRTEVDLVCIGGDLAHQPGDELATLGVWREVIGAVRARSGCVGVFGNHDSAWLHEHLAGLAGVRWLLNRALDIDAGGAVLRVLGSSEPEDLLGAALHASTLPGAPDLTIAVAHYPTQAYAAHRLGVPLVLAGHTHGGQIRLGAGRAFHTSSDLPGAMASGVLRVGDTLCCVTRGLGESAFDLRINCPPHVPVYTLRRGPIDDPDPGAGGAVLRQIRSW